MDTSLIEIDVQPTYVRVMVKGKVSLVPKVIKVFKAQTRTKLCCLNLKKIIDIMDIEKENPVRILL